MNNPEIDFVIKDKLEKLSMVCLDNAGVFREYTDEELFQASLIFQEVFMARLYSHHVDKLEFEGLCKLTEEAGKSLHQTVLLFTGVDLKNIKI
jgi:hypothetical protein